jgi:hypothetical protein
MIVHVDGDVVCYRAGFAAEHTFYRVHFYEDGVQKTQEFKGAKEYKHFLSQQDWSPVDYWVETEVRVEDEGAAIYNVRSIIASICADLQVDPETELRVYLTGATNFRNDIAKTLPYKGNRDARKKPVHAAALKDYIRRSYNTTTSVDQEADDDMSIAHFDMWCDDERSSCIATTDKDLDMVPGMHYNFVTKEAEYITPEESIWFFYRQLLTGDTVDNIPGIHGFGNKVAEKLLPAKGTVGEAELYPVVREQYAKAFGDEADAKLVEFGRLLWMRRKPGELWLPPGGDV